MEIYNLSTGWKAGAMIYFIVTMICFHCFVVGAVITGANKEKEQLPSLLAAVIHAGFVIWGISVLF